MGNYKITIPCAAFSLTVLLGTTSFGATGAEGRILQASTGHALSSDRVNCRKYTVVWSGGIASRGPDRIRPRPVRSRWQQADDSRIRCNGNDSFGQTRVAEQPWIR